MSSARDAGAAPARRDEAAPRARSGQGATSAGYAADATAATPGYPVRGRPATVLRLVSADVPAPLAVDDALVPTPAEELADDGVGAPRDPLEAHEAAGGADLRALRERAVTAAVRGYTATHGHPLDHGTDTSGGTRWAVSTRVAVAAVVALAIPVAAVVVRSWRDEPVTALAVSGPAGEGDAGDATRTDAQGGSADPAADEGATQPDVTGADVGPAVPEASEVVVHVVGQVVRPGLAVLAGGSRVADAVAAAGGATGEADLAAVNLARALVDGEQIVVPRPGEQVPGDAVPATGASGPTAADEVVDLNTAQVADLDRLPGIGPVLAQRIIDWRTEHGRFSSVDELAEVRGIGPSLLADLRAAVRV